MFKIPALWDAGPVENDSRNIAGHVITFRRLPIRERFAFGLEVASVFSNKELTFESLTSPAVLHVVERLVALSDAAAEVFDEDLTLQIPVALTAADINFFGLFDAPQRLLLSNARHKAVRKLLSKPAPSEAEQIGPTIKQEWFLFRPVVQEACSYSEMFVDERFTFRDIHLMHEILDFKQYGEIVANQMED